jgi:hypothetical protein
MATFALLHGGAHGAWCWQLLVPCLEDAGHHVVTPDLPFDDPDGSAAQCVTSAVKALVAGAGGDDVVVVGHSAAGTILPLVAAAAAAARMVFLCAAVPAEGRSWADQIAAGDVDLPVPGDGELFIDERGRAIFSADGALQRFFHDCPDDLASSSANRLVPFAATLALASFPVGAWPDIPADYVLGTEDRAIPPAWSRRVCSERLGLTPVEPSTGHSPFLSAPELLASTLGDLTGGVR